VRAVLCRTFLVRKDLLLGTQDGRITESILHVSVVKSARPVTLPNRVLRSD